LLIVVVALVSSLAGYAVAYTVGPLLEGVVRRWIFRSR
jgi:hypothetical protein